MLVGINPKTGNQVDQDFLSYQNALFAKENNDIWKQMIEVSIHELEAAE
jgi:hypothetical protein